MPSLLMRDAIERRIRELLAGSEPRFDWLRPAVRRHGFLPLYVGWVTAFGLRPDGSLVRWDHEQGPEAIRPLTDPYWRRVALCQGTRRYPELASLVPARPAEARDCDSCKGAGQITAAPQLVCRCGGLGWVLPGEPRTIAG